jgi:hypothetical protein
LVVANKFPRGLAGEPRLMPARSHGF